MGRQFSLNQGPPTEGVSRVTFNDCFSYFKIESFTTICHSRDSSIIPPRSHKGRYTEEGLCFWKDNLELFWLFPHSDHQRVTPSRILRNHNSLHLPSPKKGEDRNRGECGQNVFLSEKKFVTKGHNAKIEDEIFETSAEFLTPAVRHGKGKELKRIEKSSEPVYDKISFHNLSGRSSDYDSKDDAPNRESEGFPIKKRKAELLYENHKKIKLSSPVSTYNPVQGGEPLDSTTEIVKDDRNVKQSAFGDNEKKTEFLSNSLSTGVGVEGGKGVGIDVVDIEKVGVDVEKVEGDDVRVEMVGVDVEKVGVDDVGVEMVGVDFEKVEKVGGDYVGGETVGVDFEKVGGDYVGGEMVGGDYVGGETFGVDVEKPDKVGDLFLSKTRVYNR
ncbi:hypothetical protein F0562_015156 [Nyssa sinensis]|uniref:Uncharacterized protein n=1 Tax=Nyssa sinensis TaxID=561372 RepID=A0A5J4ZJK6_9ASTE|nr:hypothetical protein F0562_015156 [Nyssa sinensis]